MKINKIVIASLFLILQTTVAFTMEKSSASTQYHFVKDEIPAINYCSITCKQGEKNVGFVNIIENKLATLEAFAQRQGIGSQLFITALEYIKQKGYERVSWNATTSSREFYKKFGARELSLNKEYFPLIPMEFDFKRDGNPKENRRLDLLKKGESHENK